MPCIDVGLGINNGKTSLLVDSGLSLAKMPFDVIGGQNPSLALLWPLLVVPGRELIDFLQCARF